MPLQVHTVYMGVVDIYYGSFRTLRALSKVIQGTSKWRTFQALGHSPLMTMFTFAANAQVLDHTITNMYIMNCMI
jgi:hypothetical protein